MSIRILCTSPHPVLRSPAKPVARITKEVRRLAADLVDTMHAHNGIGIAAPQVGSNLQIFVANPSQQQGKELVLINPNMESSTGRASIMEGCLSLPEIWGRVKRSERVHLCAQDVNGKWVEIEATGLLAIILQHELDHLNGRLFIDRLPWLRRRSLRLHLSKSKCA